MVAAGGALFSRFRASIRESGRQNAHETVAGARFHTKFTTKKLTGSDHFLKMGSRKCARDCSKSSISHTEPSRIANAGALLDDEVDKMCTRLEGEFEIQ